MRRGPSTTGARGSGLALLIGCGATQAASGPDVEWLLVGNGVRLGLGAGWPWHPKAMFLADFSVDVVRYGVISVEGAEISCDDPARAYSPVSRSDCSGGPSPMGNDRRRFRVEDLARSSLLDPAPIACNGQ